MQWLAFLKPDLTASLPAFVLAQAGEGGKAVPSPSMGSLLLPMLIFFGIWYVLMLMPQQKERKKRMKMLESLRKNDRVVTTSGMLGTVANISPDGKEVVIRFADNVKIPFLRSAVQEVLREPDPEPPAAS